MTHRDLVTDEAVEAARCAVERDILFPDMKSILSEAAPHIAKSARIALLKELIAEVEGWITDSYDLTAHEGSLELLRVKLEEETTS